jgi:transposase-like protein
MASRFPGTLSSGLPTVTEELAARQSRPPDRIYPVVLTGAIYVKIRHGQVTNRPV